MINAILKIGNYGNDNEDRSKILFISSWILIFFNILLSVFKVGLFIFTGSVSIFADSINNLSDSISSIVVLVGTKLADKPSDNVHPHGHGRIEYITALLISVIVFVMGAEFLKVSIFRIINPIKLKISIMSILLMFVFIIIKIYMVYFSDKISKITNSLPMRAQSKDYLGDVGITTVILISSIGYKFFDFSIDGYIGVLVSLFILYSGYDLLRETLRELIGKVPEEFVRLLENKIISNQYILGVHDIVVSNFGSRKIYVMADVEMDYSLTLVHAHNIIDKIEREIKKEFGCNLRIHIDPIGYYSEQEEIAREILKNLIDEDKRLKSFHDLLYENECLFVYIIADGNIVSENELSVIIKNVENELFDELGCNLSVSVERGF